MYFIEYCMEVIHTKNNGSNYFGMINNIGTVKLIFQILGLCKIQREAGVRMPCTGYPELSKQKEICFAFRNSYPSKSNSVFSLWHVIYSKIMLKMLLDIFDTVRQHFFPNERPLLRTPTTLPKITITIIIFKMSSKHKTSLCVIQTFLFFF